MNKLLTRDQFRDAVFKRDNYKCVICGQPACDAHHIVERRLFVSPEEFGGYFLDNGASVCQKHHLLCESTEISTDEVRRAAGIKQIILPSHLYSDEKYDKWGNIILTNGSRLRGELFDDPSVQKIIKPVLSCFTKYVKYGRTYHLPWSLGMNDDDRQHHSTEQWLGRRVIVTLKMDGENTTMYRDHIHARSINSTNHPSRTWVKNFWSRISHDIPDGWRICGENLYAEHSIHYYNLPSYFLGFSIWNDKNICLDWNTTLEYFEIIGIKHPEILYDDIFQEDTIKSIKINYEQNEGYVLRLADNFHYNDFKKYVGKFVRPNHVQTTKHWMYGQPVIQNQLAN